MMDRLKLLYPIITSLETNGGIFLINIQLMLEPKTIAKYYFHQWLQQLSIH